MQSQKFEIEKICNSSQLSYPVGTSLLSAVYFPSWFFIDKRLFIASENQALLVLSDRASTTSLTRDEVIMLRY